MDFDIPSDKIALITLETVIQIAAYQRAHTKVMIEMLAKDDDVANEAIESLNEEIQYELDSILEQIYLRHGTIDLRNIFKKP